MENRKTLAILILCFTIQVVICQGEFNGKIYTSVNPNTTPRNGMMQTTNSGLTFTGKLPFNSQDSHTWKYKSKDSTHDHKKKRTNFGKYFALNEPIKIDEELMSLIGSLLTFCTFALTMCCLVKYRRNRLLARHTAQQATIQNLMRNPQNFQNQQFQNNQVNYPVQQNINQGNFPVQQNNNQQYFTVPADQYYAFQQFMLMQQQTQQNVQIGQVGTPIYQQDQRNYQQQSQMNNSQSFQVEQPNIPTNQNRNRYPYLPQRDQQ